MRRFAGGVTVLLLFGLGSRCGWAATSEGLSGWQSEAYDVSDDGSVVVGFANSDPGREAFRWTAAGGMVGLSDLVGGRSGAPAMSAAAALGLLLVSRRRRGFLSRSPRLFVPGSFRTRPFSHGGSR